MGTSAFSASNGVSAHVLLIQVHTKTYEKPRRSLSDTGTEAHVPGLTHIIEVPPRLSLVVFV